MKNKKNTLIEELEYHLNNGNSISIFIEKRKNFKHIKTNVVLNDKVELIEFYNYINDNFNYNLSYLSNNGTNEKIYNYDITVLQGEENE